MNQYVVFDEIEDVLSSTDLLALVVGTLLHQPTNWKWAILAAHSGLQGALVCAVKDSTETSVLEKDSAKKMLAWLQTPEADPPDAYLANFNTLLKNSGDVTRQFRRPPLKSKT